MSSAVSMPRPAGDAQRLQNGRLGARVAEMRSRRQHRPRRANKILVDVLLAERHVGAVLAVEDQRELLASRMPRMTRAVRRSGSIFTPRVSTPSRASCSRMKRPMCSSPTPVITADFNPSRAVPQAMFVGEPPMYFVERPHVLQPPADLSAVEIHAATGRW